jgi:N-hydroxyarylamine O-acetyltransferase
MDINRYLARIGLDHRPPPTLDGLKTVHAAHLLAIPYENLDVQLGRPVTIERPPIFDKIVSRRRGGWCYEMNGMLGWALRELGFRVTRAAGAVMREMSGDNSNNNHLVLRIDLPEGAYLADAGFGDGSLDPIKVEEGAFTSNGFDYSLSRLDDHWWRMHHHAFGGPKSFDFSLAPADESALAARCTQLQTAPDSTFVLNLLCFRQREGAVDALRGRILRTVTPDGAQERRLDNAGELLAVLHDVFGLDVPEAASLWPKICARHDEILAMAAASSASENSAA